VSGSERYKPDFQLALDRIVYDSVRPASAALGILYAILSVSHGLVLPRAMAIPMVILAAGSAGALWGLY